MRLLSFTTCLALTTALRLTPAVHVHNGISNICAPLARFPRSSRITAQELPAGWTVGLDEASGTTYYVNEQTGESSWELPQQGEDAQLDYSHAQQDDAQVLPAGWTVGLDEASGSTYYYNEQTGETSWQAPIEQGYGAQFLWTVTSAEGWGPRYSGKYQLRNGDMEVLGRYDLFTSKPTRPWVSREQCSVLVEADGTAIVVSRGKPPTGWRAPGGGPWQWLMRDEMHLLSHGDQLSLDYQDPEGTVFTCHVGPA